MAGKRGRPRNTAAKSCGSIPANQAKAIRANSTKRNDSPGCSMQHKPIKMVIPRQPVATNSHALFNLPVRKRPAAGTLCEDSDSSWSEEFAIPGCRPSTSGAVKKKVKNTPLVKEPMSEIGEQAMELPAPFGSSAGVGYSREEFLQELEENRRRAENNSRLPALPDESIPSITLSVPNMLSCASDPTTTNKKPSYDVNNNDNTAFNAEYIVNNDRVAATTNDAPPLLEVNPPQMVIKQSSSPRPSSSSARKKTCAKNLEVITVSDEDESSDNPAPVVHQTHPTTSTCNFAVPRRVRKPVVVELNDEDPVEHTIWMKDVSNKLTNLSKIRYELAKLKINQLLFEVTYGR
uniref:Uncharacterized protein n=1 Tax=Ditylenchus dipsaci TaxID=166011 RepID=A0A915DGG4_9BILA